MIVTCTNCDTSFQLDDARVPNQGIRVRCSRCKEAFFLQHPSASPSDAVDAVASEAAQSGGTRPPDMTQDLPPGAQVQGDEDEHDWEFNVDPSEAKESQDEGQGAFGGLSQNGASGLALEGEEEAKNDPGDPAVEEDDEESAFGSVDDFSSLMEEDDQTRASDLDTGSQEAADDEQSSVQPAQPNLADAGQYAEQGRSEDLGEPENWDFFGDASDDPAATSSLDGGQASAAIGSVELAPRGSLGDSTHGIGALTEAWEAAEDDDYDGEAAAPSVMTRGLAWAGQGAGWAATIALVGLALVSGFWGIAESLVSTPQTLEVGPLQAENVRGQWVDTSRGETLLAVVGELRSREARPVVAVGIVEVALLRHDGRPVDVHPQPAGVLVSETDLREAEPDVLRMAQDRAAWSLANRTIEQGRGTPFQAIFRDVPAEATRVTLRIARENRPIPEPSTVGDLGVPADSSLAPAALERPAREMQGGAPSLPTAPAAPLARAAPLAPAAPAEAPAASPGAAPDAAAPASLPSELTWGP